MLVCVFLCVGSRHMCHLKFPPPPLRSIQALLSAPNPEDPLDEGVAKHWKDNEDGARDVGMSGCGSCATP